MTPCSVLTEGALARARALRDSAAPLAAVAIGAYALKRFYASASAEDLAPLLQPTASIVSFVSGYPFIEERGSGYLSRELGVLIAPSCAGANYLVVAFVLLTVCFLPRFVRPSAKWAWLGASAFIAYLVTLAVNALRVLLTLAMKADDALRFGVSFEQAHRIEGVIVYLGSLWLLYVCTEQVFTQGESGFVLRARHIAVPWLLYVGITLVVPLVNGAPTTAAYTRHAGTVLAVSSLAAAGLALARGLLRVRRTRPNFGRL
jgi:exosortase K